MGAGRGRQRRARVSIEKGVTFDPSAWEKFANRSKLAPVHAAEYYGINLAEPGPPRTSGDEALYEKAQCSLAKEILRDLVVTGALTLPPSVSVEEFSFDIRMGILILIRSYNGQSSYHSITPYPSYELSRHLKMHDNTFHQFCSELFHSVAATL